MAGNQSHDKNGLLAGLLGRRGKQALALLTQLFEVTCQALVTNDFGHRLILQPGGGIDHTLLVKDDKRHHDAESQDKNHRQQRKSTTGANTFETG